MTRGHDTYRLGSGRHGTLRAAGSATLRQAADEWLAAAQAGLVRNRSGDPYKPSALRGYEQALRARLLQR